MNNILSKFNLYELFRIFLPGLYILFIISGDLHKYINNDESSFDITIASIILVVLIGSIIYSIDFCRIFAFIRFLDFLPTQLMKDKIPDYQKPMRNREREHIYYSWYENANIKTKTEFQSTLYHFFSNIGAASVIVFILCSLKPLDAAYCYFNLLVLLLSISGIILIYRIRLKYSWQRNFAQFVKEVHPELEYNFSTNTISSRTNSMNNSLDSFIRSIMSRFTLDITDYVFLMIENDRELLQDYLRQVSNGSLDAVNQKIGKEVKDFFQLDNLTENNSPKSKLIKSYTRHERP